MKKLLQKFLALFQPRKTEQQETNKPVEEIVIVPAAPIEPEPVKEEKPMTTSKYKLSQTSLNRLATVKEPLQRVVKRAIELTEVDFGVGQANRTRDDQMRLYGQGRTAAQMSAAGLNPAYAKPSMQIVTKTMNSNHIGGNAVDLVPYINGTVEWDNSGKLGLWPKIAWAMKTAAAELGVGIVWGGDWKSFVDRPHFELAK